MITQKKMRSCALLFELKNYNKRHWMSHSDKVLKLLVLLLQLLKDIYRLHVMTAELSIDLLHLLSISI